jgi:hypothetical protein
MGYIRSINKLINGIGNYKSGIIRKKLSGKFNILIPESPTFHMTINNQNYLLNSLINHMINSYMKVKHFDFCNDPLRSLHIDSLIKIISLNVIPYITLCIIFILIKISAYFIPEGIKIKLN